MSGFVSIVLMPIRYLMIAGFAVLAIVYYQDLDLMTGGRLDFENILPAAMLQFAPVGILGLILAGLLGIGGGQVIVPLLVFCFVQQGIPDAMIMHLALGTSLASIMFTSVSSLKAHHDHGAVKWQVVRRIVAGILVGTLAGSWFAAALTTRSLIVFFALFLLFVAFQILLKKKPKPTRELPGRLGMNAAGGLIVDVGDDRGVGAVDAVVVAEVVGVAGGDRNRGAHIGTENRRDRSGETHESNRHKTDQHYGSYRRGLDDRGHAQSGQ